MGATTEIDWTDATPNPLSHHCDPVGPECDNCYAMAIADHWHGKGFFTSAPPVIIPARLFLPWKDNKMREAYKQFVCSMSDPFHGRLSFSDQALLWAWMAADRRKVKQVLTKRGGIMKSRLNSARFEAAAYAHLDTLERMALSAKRITPWRQAMIEDIQATRDEWTWPLRNVWLGVSVGLQDSSRRLDQLAATPAATRIVSCEPLIGHLNVTPWISGPGEPLIHQVIGGGESGARHRPVDIGHARALRDQCLDARVPFWWKQNGGRTHKSGGDLLDGRRWKQWPVARPGVLV
jgi:protein gp37